MAAYPLLKAGARAILACFYAFAGVMHLVRPGPFIAITPDFVPFPALVVALSGIAEIVGAIAIIQPKSLSLRRAGGAGLALYALCVWPANINHFAMDMAREDSGGLGLAYHVPRMVAQPLIIAWALWAGEVLAKRQKAGRDG
ncbi:MAG: DoxX family protein [Erythrobacter sp.]|jgi:uncharacterized membrane protein|nr:DoxX family protein [Erythrobacter sp.]